MLESEQVRIQMRERGRDFNYYLLEAAVLVLKNSLLPRKRELGLWPKLVRTVMYFANKILFTRGRGLRSKFRGGQLDLDEFCQVGE